MGRLLILIFLKVRNEPQPPRFTVSVPACIRRGGRVSTDCLRFDLTQTETLVPQKRLSLFFFFFFFAVSLQTQRVRTAIS